MPLVVKDLIDAGVHYGHRASRWNPKMKPYIYGKRNLIHIIDLKETVRGSASRDQVLQPSRGIQRTGSVCRHQAPGGRHHHRSNAIGRGCPT